MHISNHKSAEPRLVKIEITKSRSATCPEIFSMVLDYSGILYDPEADDPAGSSGFFFSGASYFYPQSKGPSPLVTFEMQVSLPGPWQAVSQGKRSGDHFSAYRIGAFRASRNWRMAVVWPGLLERESA